jgi:hypothetical protein
VLTRNSEGITPDICGARPSSPAKIRTFQRMHLDLGSCQEVNPCRLPRDNQPDILDQFMGNKNGRRRPDQNRPRPGADPQLPAWSIQVSCR